MRDGSDQAVQNKIDLLLAAMSTKTGKHLQNSFHKVNRVHKNVEVSVPPTNEHVKHLETRRGNESSPRHVNSSDKAEVVMVVGGGAERQKQPIFTFMYREASAR